MHDQAPKPATEQLAGGIMAILKFAFFLFILFMYVIL